MLFPLIFPELKTAHLSLKQVQIVDLVPLLEIARFRYDHPTENDVKALLSRLDADFKAQQSINWGLYLDGELIGTCGFYRGFSNQIGEVGFVMRKAFRRRGFMYEALEVIARYGFQTLYLKSIVALTLDKNNGAVGVLEKVGFSRTKEMDGEHRKYELTPSY